MMWTMIVTEKVNEGKVESLATAAALEMILMNNQILI